RCPANRPRSLALERPVMSRNFRDQVEIGRPPMKPLLGWLTFVLAIAFAAGLLLTIGGYAWGSVEGGTGFFGFFGFGIPMLLTGGASWGLWQLSPPHLTVLGWTATGYA